MNFIVISPTFPKTYWQFCRALKNIGVNTLAIGEDNYDSLSNELKNNITEYYRVNSLENYDEVYRACAFFAFKYGKIDGIESNNEYWLAQDAKLRDDFNINSGYHTCDLKSFKYKSGMKEFYNKANVPCARYHIASTLEDSLNFVKEVGYPLCVKPDNGVGAFATYRINNEEELIKFHSQKLPCTYIMEEFIFGDIISYDGIADFDSEIAFETAHVFNYNVMDIVNDGLEMSYYSLKEIPKQLKEYGRACVKAFNLKGRFFHMEFFKLTKAKEGLGEVGDYVALEVNMRPPGAYTPDMMNWANDLDVYQIWANVMCHLDSNYDLLNRPYYCSYVSRRDGVKYRHTISEIETKFSNNLLDHDRMPSILATAMGDYYFVARFKDFKDISKFRNYIQQKVRK